MPTVQHSPSVQATDPHAVVAAPAINTFPDNPHAVKLLHSGAEKKTDETIKTSIERWKTKAKNWSKNTHIPAAQHCPGEQGVCMHLTVSALAMWTWPSAHSAVAHIPSANAFIQLKMINKTKTCCIKNRPQSAVRNKRKQQHPIKAN